MKQVFKPVVGYEGLYEVSNDGVIRMLERKFVHTDAKSGFKICKARIVKQTINPWGYLYVELSDQNRNRKKIFSHVIVAKAFIPNPENKPCVNHKNGIKSDNRASELEWVTRSENTKHAYRLGLLKVNKTALGKKGVLSPHSIKINQLTKEGEFIKEWPSQSEAGQTLGINPGNIWSAMNDRYKSTGGFKWEYSKNNL